MQKNTDIVSKTIKILGNCIFFPLIFIILLCSIMMYISKTNRQVPSLFGYSVVTVLTGSMEPDFSPGDTVIVKATRVGDLKVGDVIAFYEYQQPGISVGDLIQNVENVPQNPTNNSENVDTTISGFLGGGAANDYQKNVAQNSNVVFHKIEQISTLTDKSSPYYGKIFFYTTGNTQSSTKAWIMEDYVVGRYQQSSGIIGLLLSISSSSVGSLMLIIVPAAVLGILLVLSFVKDIKKQLKEQSTQEQLQINQDAGNQAQQDIDKDVNK